MYVTLVVLLVIRGDIFQEIFLMGKDSATRRLPVERAGRHRRKFRGAKLNTLLQVGTLEFPLDIFMQCLFACRYRFSILPRTDAVLTRSCSNFVAVFAIDQRVFFPLFLGSIGVLGIVGEDCSQDRAALRRKPTKHHLVI